MPWFYNSTTRHNYASAPGSHGTGEEYDLDGNISQIIFSLQNLNYTIMDSNSAHHPVFLIFPPEITVPEYQSTELTGTTYESSMPFPEMLTKRMKILGVSKICHNVTSTESMLI